MGNRLGTGLCELSSYVGLPRIGGCNSVPAGAPDHPSSLLPGLASDQTASPALSSRVKTLGQRIRGFLRCRILRPLLRLLKRGVSPKRLAWSLAVAFLVGVNPFLGLTTVTMLLLAWIFNLNQVATQIGIHVVAPLQWLLFLPFIHEGRHPSPKPSASLAIGPSAVAVGMARTGDLGLLRCAFGALDCAADSQNARALDAPP